MRPQTIGFNGSIYKNKDQVITGVWDIYTQPVYEMILIKFISCRISTSQVHSFILPT
jgi:hypothetical protein